MTPIPSETANRALDDKVAKLEMILRSLGRVLIGYSGGVDSAMLAVAAHRILGDQTIAFTADSESYATGELEEARSIMTDFGIRHEVVRTHELDNPDYARNTPDRCYFCKQELFTHMQEFAVQHNVPYILYGQNVDDVGDFRPGSRAARDYHVRAPLQEAGLTKADVRTLAKRWGLSVWDRPAMACLSSRFPYGTPVTTAGLQQIDQTERWLKDRGYPQLRVRHHNDLARLELPPKTLRVFLKDHVSRRAFVTACNGFGYTRVAVDLRGFRSGSLNEALLSIEPDSTDLPARVAVVLQRLGWVVHHYETRERLLLLRLPADVPEKLAQEKRRRELVESLENLGLHYIALNLEPLI